MISFFKGIFIIYLICNLNFYFHVKFMENIFKFYRQKLAIDNSYTLLYVKFFIKNTDFDHSKKRVSNMRYKDFFLYEMVSNRKLRKNKDKLIYTLLLYYIQVRTKN